MTTLMTNENIKYAPHDYVFEKTILKIIPNEVHPNHVTVFRAVLIPFVLYYLWQEQWIPSLSLFLFAAFTDALDGTLARVRKQITAWGTVADPLVDKLLIGSVVLIFVAREINPLFAVLIIAVELLIIAGAINHGRHGRLGSANNYGKIKMFLQVLGVSLLLIAKILGFQLAVPFAIGTFSVAIVFAIVSLLTYGI